MRGANGIPVTEERGCRQRRDHASRRRSSTLTYVQAIVIGVLRGVTELFPISSLGHSVLVPELLGWHNLVAGQSADEWFCLVRSSRYLSGSFRPVRDI